MTEPTLTPPAGGAKITIAGGRLNVPNNPIIPFIEGDGTGPDIWRASVRVLDAAVEKAYGGARKIHWLEVFAGEKSFTAYNNWLPDSTVQAWLDHPQAGPWLREVLGDNEFVTLFHDPVNGAMMRAIPLQRIARFPGFPVTENDLDAVVARFGS